MNAPSFDIVDMLESSDSGVTDIATFSISRGIFPEDEPNCCVIVDIPGGSPQLTMDNALYEFTSVQIKVRCVDYDEGWAFISSIKDSLHGRANEQWNGTLYTLIYCLNGPGFMKRINQRTTFVINFNVQRRLI